MSSQNKIMLTTEKDFVRLSNDIDLIYYIEIETQFVEGKNEFDNLIINYVKSVL